jgi:hypothetical protein
MSATLKDADKLRWNAAKQADWRYVAVRHPIAFHRRPRLSCTKQQTRCRMLETISNRGLTVPHAQRASFLPGRNRTLYLTATLIERGRDKGAERQAVALGLKWSPARRDHHKPAADRTGRPACLVSYIARKVNDPTASGGAFSQNTLHSVGGLEPFDLVILLADVALDQIGRDWVASRTDVLPIRPEFATPLCASQLRAVRSEQFTSGDALDHVHHRGWRIARRTIHKQMHVVRLNRECFDTPFLLATHVADQFLEPRSQARR